MMTTLATFCLKSANRSQRLALQAHDAHDEAAHLYWEVSVMRWMHLFRSCLLEGENHARA